MKRTHPKTIGEILEEFFQRPYVARKIAEGHIPDYWREIVGPTIRTWSFQLKPTAYISSVEKYGGSA